MTGLNRYLRVTRAQLQSGDREHVRAVYRSDVLRAPEVGEPLERWMVGKVPFYYRHPEAIANSFTRTTDFRKPLRDTLRRMPNSESFRESHFGEIVAGIFAEHVLELRLLYSKLSLLTTQNANANKMDLVLYDPRPTEIEFVFAEVKSSTKQGPEAACHDEGCFKKLFDSFNLYKDQDRDFDLAVIEERLRELPGDDAARVFAALNVDGDPSIRYAGVCVIDSATQDDEEAAVLATRRNAKMFDVDVLCVGELGPVAAATYQLLEEFADLVR
jgi:hypothetical protein